MENICKFIPATSEVGGINIINFVYETKRTGCGRFDSVSVYRAILVIRGEASFKTYAGEIRIKTGDVIFNFPSVRFFMDADNDFEYMYISYIGVRANMLMDKLGINSGNCVFHNMEALEPVWKNAIESKEAELKCEAALLYTFSELKERQFQEKSGKNNDKIIRIKRYIDENFASPYLDIKQISEEFSYSEKYLSAMFKREFKIGILEYLKIVRIQYACTLMQQGLSSVSDISLLCGYSDPLYFSKVFKSKMGVSPRVHINEIRR